VCALARIFAAGWPLTIPTCVYLLHYGTNGALTRWRFGNVHGILFRRWGIWMSAWMGLLYSKIRWPLQPPPAFRKCTPELEARYWKASERYSKVFRSSDANTTPSSVPLIKYYVPKLLPTYRSTHQADIEATEYHLPARAFCKWHRMVFRGPLHPTPRQAECLIKNYGSRDRQQMHRMSRLLTDEEVFTGTVPWTPLYRNMWRNWLDTKGPDIVIVFR